MQYPYLLLLATIAIAAPSCSAKKFSRCELARELVRQGLSREKINDWVCLVENESGRNTSAVGGPNSNGTYDYGLFQVNGRLWCLLGTVGGDCRIKCEDLIDDDITDDVQCVRKIYKRHGFSAWHGWTKRCKNKTIPDVSNCFS